MYGLIIIFNHDEDDVPTDDIPVPKETEINYFDCIIYFFKFINYYDTILRAYNDN